MTQRPVVSDSEVERFRSVVLESSRALAAAAGDRGRALRILEQMATEPELDAVLRHVPERDTLWQRVEAVYADFVPRASATAESAHDAVRILLLQQIELAWWRESMPFERAADVRGSTELVRLPPRDHRLAHEELDDRLLPRARNYAVRRWFPHRRPGGAGLAFPYVRPEVRTLLGELAGRFVALDGGSRPLWINSVTRPMDYQRHLQSLGFSAHLPSAHCTGWAVDIEARWYDRVGGRAALDSLIGDYLESRLINAIDEGAIWHICPSPLFVAGVDRGAASTEGEQSCAASL